MGQFLSLRASTISQRSLNISNPKQSQTQSKEVPNTTKSSGYNDPPPQAPEFTNIRTQIKNSQDEEADRFFDKNPQLINWMNQMRIESFNPSNTQPEPKQQADPKEIMGIANRVQKAQERQKSRAKNKENSGKSRYPISELELILLPNNTTFKHSLTPLQVEQLQDRFQLINLVKDHVVAPSDIFNETEDGFLTLDLPPPHFESSRHKVWKLSPDNLTH